MATAAALIVAAGRGHRVGGPLPKQYRALSGHAVLGHSVQRFATHPRIDRVRVVIDPADRPLYDEAVRESGGETATTLLAPVAGGATRQESVLKGLESLVEAPPDLVLIHDGARPLVSAAVIDGVLGALEGHDGALPALAVSDSLKRAVPDSPLVVGAVSREGLWRAQTPQGFRFPAILAAHRAAAGSGLTDDAAVAEQAGLSVALTPGDEDNIKITTEQDFARAERILAAQDERSVAVAAAFETRVGMGYDVHRFGPGDHLMLGGVAVPHAQGVVSHSDGDVVLHAVVDAVLGALAAGRYRHPLPAQRRDVAGCRVRALRGPRAQAAGGSRRLPRPRGCHGHLPAAQDRPAPRGHAGTACGCSGPGIHPHQPEGDHDGASGLHRARRRHRRPGYRHDPTARGRFR